MDIELKPCPFCGSAADMLVSGDAGFIRVIVRCRKCSTEKERRVAGTALVSIMQEVLEKAADTWNRRAENAS